MPRKGVAYVITPAWKMAVAKALDAKGWNKSRLAEELDCSRTAVSDLLGDGATSTLMLEVERLLGMPPTQIGTLDGQVGEFQKIGATGEVIPRPLAGRTPVPIEERRAAPGMTAIPVIPRDVGGRSPNILVNVVEMFVLLDPGTQEAVRRQISNLLSSQQYNQKMLAFQASELAAYQPTEADEAGFRERKPKRSPRR